MAKLTAKFKSLKKTTKVDFATYLGVIAVFIVVTVLQNGGMLNRKTIGLLVPICCYMSMAVSLNLTVGILGELSLGHAGFMSVGAFSGVIVSQSLLTAVPNAPVRLAIAMVVGAIFAAIVGLLVGTPVLRLQGDYLAIVTLAFGEIIKSIFNNLYLGVDARGLHVSLLHDKTGIGEDGKLIINGAMGISNVAPIATFTMGALLIVLTLAIVFNLVNSRAGRAIMAIRDNSIAAESVGIPLTRYKMLAFVISAAIAGAAGTLFASNYSTVVANKFDFNTSILILVFVVLGGQGNMLGSIIAATVLTVLPEALRQFQDYRMLVYAIVLILVMLATNNPTIRGFLQSLWKKVTGWFTWRKRTDDKEVS